MLVLGIIAVVIIGLLATHRWFWIILFGLGTIASGFTVLASIIYFQILGAVGFLILTAILGLITFIILTTGP